MTDKMREVPKTLSAYEKAMQIINSDGLDFSLKNNGKTKTITVDVPELEDKTLDVRFITRFNNKGCVLVSMSKPARSKPMTATFDCFHE